MTDGTNERVNHRKCYQLNGRRPVGNHRAGAEIGDVFNQIIRVGIRFGIAEGGRRRVDLSNGRHRDRRWRLGVVLRNFNCWTLKCEKKSKQISGIKLRPT